MVPNYIKTLQVIRLTCCRKATNVLVPHLSSLGKLISFKYKTSLSQSFGLYTRPVLVLITMQVWLNFCRRCRDVVCALQWTVAIWVDRSWEKAYLSSILWKTCNIDFENATSKTPFIFFFLTQFVLSFNYSCMPFLPTLPPHTFYFQYKISIS